MRELSRPSDAVLFESLNVQLFAVGLASCPHCKQDLGPFLSQTLENRFVNVVDGHWPNRYQHTTCAKTSSLNVREFSNNVDGPYMDS